MFSRLLFQAALVAALVLALPCAARAQAAGEELVDPTRPLLYQRAAAPLPAAGGSALSSGYEVHSILIRSNARTAVINAQRVREGDVVGNARVVSIAREGVTLSVNGQSSLIPLYQRSIKSPAGGEG